ncbi:MAG TPA: hypothetical protein VNM47_18615 [Terriglobia bacterium]|nr:hypothetical protein [Terriglobia bacterium]
MSQSKKKERKAERSGTREAGGVDPRAQAKTAQNGRKRRSTYKPRALVEEAAVMSIHGESNEEIARQLGVKPHTVPNMLRDSELLKEYRKELAGRVPAALKNVDLLLTPGSGQSVEELGRTTRWVLDATQVAVRKTEAQVTSQDPFDGMSAEELQERIDCLRARVKDLKPV